MASQSNSDTNRYKAVRGWAEVLFRKKGTTLKLRPNEVAMPGFFKESDYERVGSFFPTQEYVYTWEIIDPIIKNQPFIPGVTRRMQLYDALTLCTLEPRPGLTTLLLLPGKFIQYYTEYDPQLNDTGELALVHRSTPFRSFRHPTWPYGVAAVEDDDDDDYESWKA
jgi:hypothetical protein